MGRLECWVRLVERVPVPVALEREHLRPVVHTRRRRPGPRLGLGPVLVDVVAEMDDQIDVLLGQAPEGGVVAVLPVLAGDERETELLASSGGRSACAPDRALLRAGEEAVEVVAAGIESLDARRGPSAPASGRACSTPRRTTLRMLSSSATSQRTATFRSGMPPPRTGSGARRVQRTTPSALGSPDATPSVKSGSGKGAEALAIAGLSTRGVAAAMTNPPAATTKRCRVIGLSLSMLTGRLHAAADAWVTDWSRLRSGLVTRRRRDYGPTS